MNVSGRTVALLDRGEGEPVVLVHSSGLGAAQWGPMLPRLAVNHRVLAPDLLGYGGTAPWPDPDNFDLAEDVAIVTATMAKARGPVHLVGHSYGGLLALRAAAAAPDRVRTLALFEPVAFGVVYGRDPDSESDLIPADEAFLDATTGGDAAWMARFINFWGGPTAWARLPQARKDALVATGRKTFLEVRALLLDRTPAIGWAAIRCPTLLMTGTRSPNVAQSVCRILTGTLPLARLRVFEGAGHMAPVEEARRVLPVLETHFETALA